MTLKKLTNDHYIIVDDSEIKEGDWVLSKLNEIVVFGKKYTPSLYRKITHSTQPLEQGYGCEIKEGLMLRNVGKELCYDLIKPLSLSEVKELLGEVDVEKKAEKFIGCEYDDIEDSIDQIGYDSFIRGYNQALEDNKDKKYTEDDLITFGIRVTSEAFSIIDGKGYVDMKKFDKILQSLQPKTEWEVEIVDGKFKLK